MDASEQNVPETSEKYDNLESGELLIEDEEDENGEDEEDVDDEGSKVILKDDDQEAEQTELKL